MHFSKCGSLSSEFNSILLSNLFFFFGLCTFPERRYRLVQDTEAVVLWGGRKIDVTLAVVFGVRDDAESHRVTTVTAHCVPGNLSPSGGR